MDRLLHGIADDPTPELMTSIAEPLPIQVIAELIGVPEERWSWVTDISTVLRRAVDPFVPLDSAEVDRASAELTTYYGSLADERAAHPTDDLLTDLVRSEAAGQINRPELLSLLVILVFAGHETTTGAIGNALVALGRNPEQRDLLRRQPELWSNAVEELLRYDTVLQTDPRQAFEVVTIAGRTIKAGQNITVMLGAANRDPARFTDPDRLRVDRDDPAPISFGHGIHYCIGAALARLELTVALPAIVDALGSYVVDETHLEWKTSLAFEARPTCRSCWRTHPGSSQRSSDLECREHP